MTSLRILILGDLVDVNQLPSCSEYDFTVAFFWAAPSTLEQIARNCRSPCIGLPDLVGTSLEWNRAAAELSGELASQGPRYRGIPWRSNIEEALWREAREVRLAAALLDWAKRSAVELSANHVMFEGAVSGVLREMLVAWTKSEPAMTFHELPAATLGVPTRNLFSRAQRRWREVRLRRSWARELGRSVDWIDRGFRLLSLMGWSVPTRVDRGCTTFFSSYTNNSATLATVADNFPRPAAWLALNQSARSHILRGQTAVWVWRFRGRRSVQVTDKGAFSTPDLSWISAPRIARWLEVSPSWKRWIRSEAHTVQRLTQSWESYLDRAQPQLVAMANQWEIEGWFMRIAAARDIPTVQLMHGLLPIFPHMQSSIASDAMVVRGSFWRETWLESERAKILVFSPLLPLGVNRKAPHGERPRLTFFSWPITSMPFLNASEIFPRMGRILSRLAQETYEVTMRPHPQEDIQDFLTWLEESAGPISGSVRIDPQNTPAQVLAATDVALCFHSTVLLDCLAAGVPVVVPGWIDFEIAQALESVTGVYLASDFEDLESCLCEWASRPPQVDRRAAEQFVAPPGEGSEEFHTLIERLLSEGGKAGD